MLGRGAIASHPATLAHRIDVEQHPIVGAMLAAGVPDGGFSLAQFQPPTLDQDGSPSCQGHSGAGGLATAFAAAGKPLGFVPSPNLLWKAGLARERAIAALGGQSMPKLKAQGVTSTSLIASFGDYGMVPMRGPTSDGRNSDVERVDDGADVPEINSADLVAGSHRPVVGAYGIDPADPKALEKVAACIASGIPVHITFFVDRAFEQLSPGQQAATPDTSDPTGGGHAIYCARYRVINGVIVLEPTNSWGDWCDHGQFLASPQWSAAAWEFHPLAVAGLS